MVEFRINNLPRIKHESDSEMCSEMCLVGHSALSRGKLYGLLIE